jgi:ABC-type lipoprotein release transport system permease subunit
MIFRDQFHYAMSNLAKTRLRTVLTAAGVSIGIGAMTSMVSVGVGTQRNVMQAFNEENLLTSVTVRPPGRSGDAAHDSMAVLNAVSMEAMRLLPGARDAYPVLNVPGLLQVGDSQQFLSLESMPARMLKEQIEREKVTLLSGRIYEEDETGGMVISTRAARRLLPEGVEPDTLVGQKVSFLVARMPGGSAEEEPESEAPILEGVELPSVLSGLPIEGLLQRIPFGIVQPVRLELTIIGVVDGAGTLTDFLGISLYVPVEIVEPLYAQTFQNLESILTGEASGEGYPLVQVLTEDVLAVRQVQESIVEMGFRADSILDQMAEIRMGFLFMNTFLATIGGISLLVAAMMIINTLVMAVLERTREIGLLKAMGATDLDVMRLFLSEAGIIGMLGGIGGLALGWIVAKITNMIANYQLMRLGEVQVDFVAFPIWLIAGGIAFALIVSLTAGFYPSRRAARVDPVVALRYF